MELSCTKQTRCFPGPSEGDIFKGKGREGYSLLLSPKYEPHSLLHKIPVRSLQFNLPLWGCCKDLPCFTNLGKILSLQNPNSQTFLPRIAMTICSSVVRARCAPTHLRGSGLLPDGEGQTWLLGSSVGTLLNLQSSFGRLTLWAKFNGV